MFVNENDIEVNYSIYENKEIILANKFIKKNDFVLELGARYGGVSCAINKILKNKNNQYSVEPDSRVWNALEKNKKYHNCDFNIIQGTISKKSQKIILSDRKFGDNNEWATYTEEGESDIPNYPLPDKPFNVLVADCEGFLENFYDENKNLFKNLRLIILEKDRPEYCNYNRLHDIFIKLGFDCIVDGFHSVYEKKFNIPILYINLDERKDRKEYMEDILDNYNYKRISAIKDDNGWIGCAKSHIKCIDYAKKNNLKSVIILEDDFMFLDNQNFENMKIPDFNYDILLLCNQFRETEDFDNQYFNKVNYCVWTSGHLLYHTLFDDLKNNLQQGIDNLTKENKVHNYLDHYWNSLWEKYTAISHKKLFATQREGYSDIKNINLAIGTKRNNPSVKNIKQKKYKKGRKK